MRGGKRTGSAAVFAGLDVCPKIRLHRAWITSGATTLRNEISALYIIFALGDNPPPPLREKRG